MPGKLISNLIDEIALRLGHRSASDDDADLNDLSYEDALLDVELRSFMRAEYGKQEAPDRVFPRIMQAIRLHREEQAKAALKGTESTARRMLSALGEALGEALVTAYRFGTRPDAGRMLSGSLVTGLVLLAVWPGMARFLNNGGPFWQNADQVSVVDIVPAGNVAGNSVENGSPNSSALPSATAFVPSAQPGGGVTISVQTQYMSPGRLFDDPRFSMAYRTGENLSDLQKHFDKSGDNGSPQGQTEPGPNRPVYGPY